jgi:hypothetical protein
VRRDDVVREHTRGNWRFEEATGEIIADGMVLGAVYGSDEHSYAENAAECRANARLIAAAPTLLAACEVALEALERRTLTSMADEHIKWQLADAIRKTRG